MKTERTMPKGHPVAWRISPQIGLVQILCLGTVCRAQAPLTVRQVADAINPHLADTVADSVLCHVLPGLVKRGWLVQGVQAAEPAKGGRRKYTYSATREGYAALRELVNVLLAVGL